MENDTLLGGFAAKHVGDLTDPQLAALEVLLDESDNDIYNWIVGKETMPVAHDTDLMTWVRKFNKCL